MPIHRVINTPLVSGETSFSHCRRKGVDVSQGPTKKGKGDVMPIHRVINTPLVSGETSFSHCMRKGVDVSQGPTKKGKGDVMPIHRVINTPLVFGETAPSISRQGNNVVNPLAFMIELVLHKSFSWAFQRYMLKFDISL